MARGRPQLQFCIARGAQLQQSIIPPIVHFQTGNRLRVAAIEALGQAEDAGQGPYRPATLPPEVPVMIVTPPRSRLAVVARDEADDLDFLGLEAA